MKPDQGTFARLGSAEDRQAAGERLRRAREILGFGQAELADAIGASKRGIQDNEAGKSVPGGQVLAGLAALGINTNWLLTGEGSERLATNVAQPVRLDPTILGQAIGVLLGVLEERGEDLSHADFGQAVLKIYDGMQGGSRSLPQVVADLVEYRNRNRG